MPDVKKKLFEILKHRAKKRQTHGKEQPKRRLVKRSYESSSGLFSFPKDKYKALEEAQHIIGLTDEELRVFFALMEKTSDGNLNFEAGNISIEFRKYPCFEESPDEIEMEIRLEEKESASTVEYKFPHGLGNIVSKQREP